MCFVGNNDDAELSELAVFEENYALLCNTITDIVEPLIKCFVEVELLTIKEENQISAVTIMLEKLRLLLIKISSLLKADNTRGFYIMLKIMKEQGCKGTQNLADYIMYKLKISADKLSYTCGDDEPEGPKGLSIRMSFYREYT